MQKKRTLSSSSHRDFLGCIKEQQNFATLFFFLLCKIYDFHLKV
jgi:hypothetical protein